MQFLLWFYPISKYLFWIYFVSTCVLSSCCIPCIFVLFQFSFACFFLSSLIINLYNRHLVHVRSAHLCMISPLLLFYWHLFWGCILIASFETYTCLAYFSSPWSMFKHTCFLIWIVYILYMIDNLILILYLLSCLWVNPLFYVSTLPYFIHLLKYASFLSWFISFIFMLCLWF